jgi:hypothetical protein
MLENMACPNHEGAFDCTPFCELCGGEQGLKISFPTPFQYQCWKCDKWHDDTAESAQDLTDFIALAGVAIRFVEVK